MPNEVVKYHNNFIEAIYSTSTIAKKLLIGISHKAQKIDRFGVQVSFSAKEICEVVGITKDGYKYLEKAIEILMKTVITVKDPDDSTHWKKVQFLGESEYKQGVLTVTIPQGMRPFLMELNKLFTVYHIENIKPLRSEYSIRIFELLKQYEKTKQRKRIFKIEELRKILGCEKKLLQYCHFKQKVLDVAQRDLEEKCDVYFKYSEKKIGRKITEITFTIFSKTPKTITKLPSPIKVSKSDPMKIFYSMEPGKQADVLTKINMQDDMHNLKIDRTGKVTGIGILALAQYIKTMK